MKKFLFILGFCLLFSFNNINAACKDYGQNESDKHVTSIYNCNTKKLYLFGLNNNSSFGTGDNKEVKKENAIEVNKFVGNKDIIDYFITSGSTFILTSDKKVYASGKYIKNGSKNFSNKFVETILYNQKNYPIESLDGYAYNRDYEADIIKYELKYQTKNKKIYSESAIDLMPPLCTMSYLMTSCGEPSLAELEYEYKYYPMYYDETGKTTKVVQVDKNRNVLYRGYYNKTNEIHRKYVKNALVKQLELFGYKDKEIITKYKDGRKTHKYLKWYRYLDFYRAPDKPLDSSVAPNGAYMVEKYQKIIYVDGKEKTDEVFKYILTPEEYYISSKGYLASKKVYVRDKKGLVKEYYFNKYNSNKKITYQLVKKGSKNKQNKRLTTYQYKGKKLINKKHYVYNKQGQLKSNKYGKAYRIKTTYQNGKKVKTEKKYYNAKGKLA